MGFGKATAREDERPAKKGKKRPERTEREGGRDEGSQHSSDGGFKPTTAKELKEIERRARKKDRERSGEKGKKARPENLTGFRSRDPYEMMEALRRNDKMRIYQDRLFDTFIDTVKGNGGEKPAYREYEKDRHTACSGFVLDIQQALARFSWIQLSKLIAEGTGVPVPVRDWSEGFHHCLNLLCQALGVKDYKKGGKCDLDDDALANWPVDAKKRRSKQEKAKMNDEELKKLHAAAGGDDDEDEGGEDEGSEDEDEGEEDEDEEEGQDEDAGSKAAKSKRDKKSKKSDDDEDEDEGDEDDGKKRKKEKKVKKDKKGKSDKKDKDRPSKPAKKEKADKAEKREGGSRASDSTVYKPKKKFEGGVRGDTFSVIPASGATMEKIVSMCRKKFKTPEHKTRSYVRWMASNGHLTKA